MQETSFMYETTARKRDGTLRNYLITTFQQQKKSPRGYISISSKSIGECPVDWCFEYTGWTFLQNWFNCWTRDLVDTYWKLLELKKVFEWEHSPCSMLLYVPWWNVTRSDGLRRTQAPSPSVDSHTHDWKHYFHVIPRKVAVRSDNPSILICAVKSSSSMV